MINILLAASECVPFIKTGGLADVAGALPKYYPKDEYDVRVVLPKYACMKEQYKGLLEYVKYFFINTDGYDRYVGIFQAEYNGIKFYFIDNEEQFQGSMPYTGMPWDLGKFTFFSKAVLSMLQEISFKPDIIHCNDWQTALIPVFLTGYKANYGFYEGIKTVLTIHNLKFQGIWNIEEVKRITGLNDGYFDYDKLEFYGMANLMKGGLAFADKITTVSHTYAKEICTDMYGEGLNPLLNFRKNDLSGILNGIDYEIYDPKNDPMIYENFDVSDAARIKAENKMKLQKELGLAVDKDKMLFGIVSRLTDQKGFDLVRDALNDIVKDGVQIVVIGTGEREYEDLFRYFAEVYSESVSANIFYSEELAQKVYASCDAFLMPSRFEPCGLSQLISMRYGTLPVVRKTGGLADTVISYSEAKDDSTGFVFNDYNKEALLWAVRTAEEVYYNNRQDWNDMICRAMNKDFSWDSSAREYLKLYNEMLGR